MPRGGSGGSNDGNSGSRVRSGGTGAATASAERGDAPTRRAVPIYSRPRSGQTVTGQAVERRVSIDGQGNIYYRPYYPYYPYYYPYGFWGPGYGFGLGYLYYDPFWYGGFGYGGYGYGGYGYGGYGATYYGSGGYSQTYRDTGSLRLKISPRDAQVFVDGYFVGSVDDFDGIFQKLTLDGGTHQIEIKADGYVTEQFEVLITPGETVTYKGDLRLVK
ncbi:MAG TPA: PEGA domain-containing protein [Vicinamibacterales bacterium]|nr:PEGA domain-containing protein [Vicinamibacterales bacterium]